VTLLRTFGVWLLLAFLMSANGIFRETVLKSQLGPRPADVLSAALGITMILFVTAIGFRPLSGAPLDRLVVVSVLLVGLTVGFEFLVGRTVDHKSWAELLGNYAIWRGRLWPTVLVVIALTPFLWGRWTAIAPAPVAG
jgi:hypothetical protein